MSSLGVAHNPVNSFTITCIPTTSCTLGCRGLVETTFFRISNLSFRCLGKHALFSCDAWNLICLKFDLLYPESHHIQFMPCSDRWKDRERRFWETDSMERQDNFLRISTSLFQGQNWGTVTQKCYFQWYRCTAAVCLSTLFAQTSSGNSRWSSSSWHILQGPTSPPVLSMVWRGDVIVQLIIPQVWHGLILNDKLSLGSLELNLGIFCPSFPSLAFSFAHCVLHGCTRFGEFHMLSWM